MTTCIYKTLDMDYEDAVRQFEVQWKELVKKSDINPSLLPGWIGCVADAFELSEKLRVFVVLDNDEVIGIIPYINKNKTFFGVSYIIIELAGNIISYHQDIISNNQHESIFNLFLSHINNNVSWDIFIAEKLVVNNKTYSMLENYSRLHKYPVDYYYGESSPYLSLDDGWDAILAKKQRKFRYKVNKREKLLNTNNAYKIEWYGDNLPISKLLDDIFHIEEKCWKVDHDMDITSNPVERKYYQCLIPFLAESGLLKASVLYIDECAVAYNLCYEWNNKIGQIKTSFEASYGELSPGAVLIEESLRCFIKDGCKEFDFLGDIMRHKLSWTKDVRKHVMVSLYNKKTLPRLMYQIKSAKRKIKKIYEKL